MQLLSTTLWNPHKHFSPSAFSRLALLPTFCFTARAGTLAVILGANKEKSKLTFQSRYQAWCVVIITNHSHSFTSNFKVNAVCHFKILPFVSIKMSFLLLSSIKIFQGSETNELAEQCLPKSFLSHKTWSSLQVNLSLSIWASMRSLQTQYHQYSYAYSNIHMHTFAALCFRGAQKCGKRIYH